jgi:hypothetical protein
MSKPLSIEVLQERKMQRLMMDNANLRAMNNKLLRSGGLAPDKMVDFFTEVLRVEKQEPFTVILPSKKEVIANAKGVINKEHTEVAALVWSDWHLSEVVKLNDSNKVNAYNSMIAANRIAELVARNIKVINLHRTMYPINKIWLTLLGDMINGSIHPELVLTNDLSDPAATVLAARLMMLAITELKTLDIPIEIDCIVGNHPRMLAKMPTKIQSQVSFDWMIYEMLADYFSDDPQIDIRIHTGQIGIVEQVGWRYIIEHGIDVKNSHEEEFEDRIRALFDDPTYRKATGLKGASFDNIIIGNLHKPAFLERTVKNGSLVGQNELGQAWRLKPIKAQQLMFGISKGHVRTWQYAIDLTDIRSEKVENSYSKYTQQYMLKHGRGRI